MSYPIILPHLFLLSNLVAPPPFHPKIVVQCPIQLHINYLSNPLTRYLPYNKTHHPIFRLNPLHTTHFNNNYPVATSKDIQQLIYMDTQKTKTNQ